MTTQSHIEFEVLWYAGGPEHAPNRVIGRDYVKRHDLTDAITAACNMLKAGKGAHDGYAHGFYVQKSRRTASAASIERERDGFRRSLDQS